MKKRIAITVESYYRTPQPNGICVKAITDELLRGGHRVSIFTSKRGYKQPNHEIVEGAVVRRFNRSIACILRNISNYYGGIGAKAARIISKFIFRINDYLKCNLWPLDSFILIIKYVISINKLHNRNRFHVILGVYLHIEEVLAAIIIKRKHPEIKLVIYTLDAMTGREVPKILGIGKIREKSMKRWERYIYRKADVICVMKSHKRHYKQRQYDDIRNKLRYVDIPLFKIRNMTNIHKQSNAKQIIVFTGHASETIHSPLYFLKILKKMKNVQLHMYGTVSDKVKEVIKDKDLLDKFVFFHGRKEHKEILRIQQEADFLVNFGCKNSTSIPSKLFEYISSRKPIINFYKISDDASYPYVKVYPDAIQLCEYDEKIDENVKALNEFMFNKERVLIHKDSLINLYYKNTPHPMAKEILD